MESKKKKHKAKDVEATADYGEVDEDLMDADVAHSWEAEEVQWDGSEESRKRLVDKYMDEVYGLDFNDMVSGLWRRRFQDIHHTLTRSEIFQLGSNTRQFRQRRLPSIPPRFSWQAIKS
jgi:hypothetical protein